MSEIMTVSPLLRADRHIGKLHFTPIDILEGLKALNIDAETWVLSFWHFSYSVR
jgi:hypothetical protein